MPLLPRLLGFLGVLILSMVIITTVGTVQGRQLGRDFQVSQYLQDLFKGFHLGYYFSAQNTKNLLCLNLHMHLNRQQCIEEFLNLYSHLHIKVKDGNIGNQTGRESTTVIGHHLEVIWTPSKISIKNTLKY